METTNKSTMPSGNTGTTRVSKIIKAPRKTVYQACLDPEAVVQWRYRIA